MMLSHVIRLSVLLLVLFGVADSAYYLPGVTPATFADTESVRFILLYYFYPAH